MIDSWDITKFTTLYIIIPFLQGLSGAFFQNGKKKALQMEMML